MELGNKEHSDGKKLVLGFDGGCLSCSVLAKRIKERVGDKLEVQNLRAPQVEGWRKEALGEDAPWGPSLFEVDGEKVKAWTGLRMGLALTRALGPADTWKVMQAIGEMRPTKEKLVPGGFTRGQFLTGVGGATLAMTILSGTSKFASPAKAHGDHHEFKGADLIDRARRNADSQDVRNVAGNNWANRMQTGTVKRRCLPGGGCEIAIATGDNCHIDLVNGKKFRVEGYCTVPKAVKHNNIQSGDNGMLKVVWVVPKEDWIIVYKQYDKPFNPDGHGDVRIETMAKLFKKVPNRDRMRLVRVSVNGKERPVKRWS